MVGHFAMHARDRDEQAPTIITGGRPRLRSSNITSAGLHETGWQFCIAATAFARRASRDHRYEASEKIEWHGGREREPFKTTAQRHFQGRSMARLAMGRRRRDHKAAASRHGEQTGNKNGMKGEVWCARRAETMIATAITWLHHLRVSVHFTV
jgi:hypothetical protein